MKLRILHLTQFLGVGGLEKVLHILIREQLQAGHQVELMVYDRDQAWVNDFRQDGITVNTTYAKAEGYDRGLLKHLARYAKKFDVVHTHDLNPLMYAAPLKLWHRLTFRHFPKLIHTAHGMDHLSKRPVTRMYERVASVAADYMVGVSPSVCEKYQSLGISSSKLRNVNNATRVLKLKTSKDEDRKFLVEEFSLTESGPIVSSVARIVPLKDQRLICQVAKRMPETNFLLVGPSGDASYWDELQATKPPNVIMTDGRKDIDRILNGSDVFLSASQHEGIPISVLEAGALALPCVLSDIPGHRMISTGVRYFEKGNADACFQQLQKILQNSAERLSLGQQLQDLVSTQFSSQRMHQEYEQLYVK